MDAEKFRWDNFFGIKAVRSEVLERTFGSPSEAGVSFLFQRITDPRTVTVDQMVDAELLEGVKRGELKRALIAIIRFGFGSVEGIKDSTEIQLEVARKSIERAAGGVMETFNPITSKFSWKGLNIPVWQLDTNPEPRCCSICPLEQYAIGGVRCIRKAGSIALLTREIPSTPVSRIIDAVGKHAMCTTSEGVGDAYYNRIN